MRLEDLSQTEDTITSPQSPPTQSDKEIEEILNRFRDQIQADDGTALARKGETYQDKTLAALHTHITRAKIEELEMAKQFIPDEFNRTMIDNRIAELKQTGKDSNG
jgi:hypothetical protein